MSPIKWWILKLQLKTRPAYEWQKSAYALDFSATPSDKLPIYIFHEKSRVGWGGKTKKTYIFFQILIRGPLRVWLQVALPVAHSCHAMLEAWLYSCLTQEDTLSPLFFRPIRLFGSRSHMSIPNTTWVLVDLEQIISTTRSMRWLTSNCILTNHHHQTRVSCKPDRRNIKKVLQRALTNLTSFLC